MHKILVVDDEEFIRFTLKAALEDRYTVFTCSDGAAALETIKKEKPVLVFLDITMQGMGGLETLKKIKEAGLNPIIWMLTGVEEMDVVFKTLELGAAGYISKPFDVEKIRSIALDAVGDTAPSDKPWVVKKKK